MRYVMVLFMLFTAAPPATARAVFLSPAEFVRQVFGADVPQVESLWITRTRRQPVRRILGHDLDTLRVRYWRNDQRTVWILNEIGKEKAITVGIAVNLGRIEQVKVLVFRESRGADVRYPYFTRQFHGAALRPDHRLDRPIDGISGATLSVRAVTKLARLALYLHRCAMQEHSGE